MEWGGGGREKKVAKVRGGQRVVWWGGARRGEAKGRRERGLHRGRLEVIAMEGDGRWGMKGGGGGVGVGG